MEDLSHDQGDSHYQEMSADEAGGVNGTGSPSHAAGRLLLSSWHTGKKKKRKLLDGILQKSSTRDGEGEVWDGVTPVS